MIALFPPKAAEKNTLMCVLADPATSSLHALSCGFEGKPVFESMAHAFPQTAAFECELAEEYGYEIINQPWPRPVRKQDGKYEFYKVTGDEVHEVAVGPIHAGVIEPGHFRFQCHGEYVFNLEISLGYQRRGVEAMLAGIRNYKSIVLAESAAGDTVIGHTMAHVRAVESLSGAGVTLRAQVIRAMALELERVAMHLAGLGGIANDVGFAMAASSYGRIRTLAINSLAALSGSRFGRGLLAYGGVNFDLSEETINYMLESLQTVSKDVAAINKCLFSSSGAMLRFEKTGIVPKKSAKELAFTGTTARSCGIEMDTRTDFPYGAYMYFPITMMTMQEGDVFARAKLRAMEIEESLRFIFEQIENLPMGGVMVECKPPAVNSAVISLTEGWRGEIAHIAVTDAKGNIGKYKIKDPSFNNWYALSLAVRNASISDFPLCNKSFDLSYAGHDL
jgi:Ni,Fe-hydrogenase III large subunit